MVTRSVRPSAVLIGAVLAIAAIVPLGVLTAPSAQADVDCETRAPYSDFAGTSMEFVYSADAAVGGAALIMVPELCVSASAVVVELANDDAVSVDVVGDGSFGATITLTAPTVDFEGIARVDLQVVDGATSFVLELYGLFGVVPTAFSFDRPDPVATAVSAPAIFSIAGIVLREGATLTAELIRSTQPVSVTVVGAPTEGIQVTPSTSYRGTIGVEVLLTDGINATRVFTYQWAGIPIPTGVVWAPNPPPVAIDPGGTGFFDLSGSFAPPQSECEIRVNSVPDVQLVVEPPSLQGVAFAPVGIQVRDPDFVGLLTVSYDLSCRLPDETVSSVDYDLLMYVGIPIPEELAATGSHRDGAVMAAGALALMLAGALMVLRRPQRRR